MPWRRRLDAPRSDTGLLLAASSDVAAFGELYERHAETVLGYFYRRTHCLETAADLTAETFAAAFTSRRRFRDVGAPALAWVLTIARRQLNHFIRHEQVAERHRRKLGRPRIELTPTDYERVEQLVDLEANRQRLTAALGSLSERQAQAITLRVIDGLAYSDVAEHAGCSEGAARVRVSRGLTHLADLLEEL